MKASTLSPTGNQPRCAAQLDGGRRGKGAQPGDNADQQRQ